MPPKKGTSKLPRGIDRLQSGAYRARIYVDGMQHTLGAFQTIGDARAALDIARGQKARGMFVPPAKIRADRARSEAEARETEAREAFTVADLYAEWSAWNRRARWKRSTADAHEIRYRGYIAPALSNRPVASVTRVDVDDWHARLVADHGPGAARVGYMTLAAMMRYAAGQARGQASDFQPYIAASPCQVPNATKHAPVGTPEREVATPEEVQALADLMPPGSGLAVLLAAWCGLRRGEVMALRRQHITQAGTEGAPVWWLKVETQLQRTREGVLEEATPKSEAGTREVPIPPFLVPSVQAHLEDDAGPGADGLLFPRRRRGTEYGRPETLAARFASALSKFNAQRAADNLPTLNGFTFHMLRHTALTRMGEAGATLEELRTVAGHASYKQVQRYQHATRDRLAALAATMGPGEAQ